MGAEFRLDFNTAPPQPPEREEAPEQLLLPTRDEILASLRLSADQWVPALFPNGKLEANGHGRLWRVADITGRAPKEKGSCCIYLDGDDAGGYHEFGPAAKDGGDAISTIADHFRLRGEDVYVKAREIAERYGRINGHAVLKSGSQAATPKRPRKDHTSEINFILSRCVPAAGTSVETYFKARGLTLPASADVLFNNDLTHYETKRGYFGIVCRVRFPDGVFTGGIHRTFLKDDCSWHIGGDKAKMMLGPCDYGVIMLAPISPEGALGIGEGVESTTAGMQLFNVPGWAAMSAGGLRKFSKWLVANPGALGIKRLLIFADRGNDGETAGVDLRNCAAGLGITAEMYLPSGGDDIADDLLKGLVPELVAADFKPERPNAAPSRELPIVQIGGGRLSTAIDEAESILLKRDKDIYQRGDFVVRPAPKIIPISDDRETVGMRLIPIRTGHMIERFTKFVDFNKFDLVAKSGYRSIVRQTLRSLI
jgi:putative DNA primase/helicase